MHPCHGKETQSMFGEDMAAEENKDDQDLAKSY